VSLEVRGDRKVVLLHDFNQVFGPPHLGDFDELVLVVSSSEQGLALLEDDLGEGAAGRPNIDPIVVLSVLN